MTTIRPLDSLSADLLRSVMDPYRCTHFYRVQWADSLDRTAFTLDLVPLPEPAMRRYQVEDEAWVRDTLAQADLRLGGYEGERLDGVLIASRHDWNRTLWVWEFHVASRARGQGLGRALMEAAVAQAREWGLRAVVCETQNRNAPGIQAYRRLGFALEGVDVSYYSNADWPDGDVAVFMKRRID